LPAYHSKAMAISSIHSPHIVNIEHQGWKLQARWFQPFWKSNGGWVCYVSKPDSSHKLNIGRWPTSDEALGQGRSHVDRCLT